MKWTVDKRAQLTRMIIEGKTNKEIGQAFGVSVSVISSTILYYNIYPVSNRPQKRRRRPKRQKIAENYSHYEICQLYRYAKNKKEQIQILTDLTSYTVDQILKILKAGKEDLTEVYDPPKPAYLQKKEAQQKKGQEHERI